MKNNKILKILIGTNNQGKLREITNLLPKNIIKIVNTHDVYGNRHKKLNWTKSEKEKFFCCSSLQEFNLIRKSNLIISLHGVHVAEVEF